MPMANWGSWGDYGGGVLWNQAPWLNNQDLFVVKDDYSAVFGKHFVKIGALASYNKKNEEYLNTSQESVAVNGAAPGRRLGRDHRKRHRRLAARGCLGTPPSSGTTRTSSSAGRTSSSTLRTPTR